MNAGKFIKIACHAYLSLFFTGYTGWAIANPVYTPAYYTLNGSNVTGTGTNPTGAYFLDIGSNGYVVTIRSGADLGNAGGSEIQFDHGTLSNSGKLTGNSFTTLMNYGTVANSGMIIANGPNDNAIEIAAATHANPGNVLNTGSIITDTGGIGILISEGNGLITNDSMVRNTGTITSGGNGIFIGSGIVINSGAITANGGGNCGIITMDGGTIINSGSVTAIGLNSAGVSSNSGTLRNSGTIVGDSAVSWGSGTIYNTGVVNGGTYGLQISQDGNIFLAGGTVEGSTDAIYVSQFGFNNTVNINGRCNVIGTMEANGWSGNVLNLNLVGMTPLQLLNFQAYVQAHQNSGQVIIGGYTYSWDGYSSVNSHGVSLELAVDPGLAGLAAKIDQNALPQGAAFDKVYVAALQNTEVALSNFSGREFLEAFSTLGLSEATHFSEMADNRAFSLRSGSYGIDFSGLNIQPSSMIASLGGTENLLSHLCQLQEGSSIISDSKSPIESELSNNSRWAAWISGTVTLVDQSGAASDPGFRATTGSPTLGIDCRLSRELVVGALFNYATSGAHFSDGSQLDSDTELLGVYTDWAHGPWFLNGLAGYGHASYNQQRTTLAGTQAIASPQGDEVLADLSGGYDFKIADWILSPKTGFQYTHLAKDGFSETGAGALDLNVGHQVVDSLRTKLGFNAARPFSWDAIKFAPDVHATWYHECLDDTNGASTSVPAAPALGSFLVSVPPQGRDFAAIGAGVSATPSEFQDNVTFLINYDAQFSQNNYLAHTISGGIRINF